MRRTSIARVLGRNARILAVILLAASASLMAVDRGDAAGPLLIPAAAGSQWRIVAGYNTATHSVADSNDPYAIDIVRTDAPSEGTEVLAPFDGTMRFSDSSCLSINDAQGTTVLLCHLFPVANMRGKLVTRGQVVGVVAPPGQANNNGLAHIHMALSNSARLPVPFDGAYVLEGKALPATTTSNGYGDTTFTSTNTPALSVNAGADLQVRPGTAVTLAAQASTGTSVTYSWRQTGGTSVSLASSGATASFTAPSANNTTLTFEVVAVNAQAQTARDTVTVRTSTAVPIALPVGAPGTFASIPVFGAQRLALAVFAGGSVDQLEAAARASTASGVWVQDATGRYQLFVIDGAAFLNAAFRTTFSAGFATATAVTLTHA